MRLYWDEEIGLYWNPTFISWLCDNIMDLTNSIYDPSMLFSTSTTAVLLLWTGCIWNVITENGLDLDEKVMNHFNCQQRKFPPIYFKEIEFVQDGSEFIFLKRLCF